MTAAIMSHPNERALELTGRDYLSWSQIDTFRQCPRKYGFRYVENLREETVSSALAFGSGAHAAIESLFNQQMSGGSIPTLDTLLGVFWDSWRSRDPEIIRYAKGEDVNTVGHLADGVLSAFLASDLAKLQGRILGVEEELRGPVVDGAPDLLARLDLLVETDAELQVIDFKTARTRWSAEQPQDVGEQLMLYSCLVGKLIPEKPVRLEYAVITKAKSPVVERYPVAGNGHRIDRTKRIFRSAWRAIQAGDFFPTPSPMSCPACPFREACRAWV